LISVPELVSDAPVALLVMLESPAMSKVAPAA